MKDNSDRGANEYIEVIVNHKLFQLCNDCYHALGWKLISTSHGIASVKLTFERNKKIKNRVELCKLQRECEDALIELESLVKLRNVKARKMVWVISIEAIIFFVGAFISYLLHLFFLSTILIVLVFTGLVFEYAIYHKHIRKIEERHIPEINRYFDDIYHLCKKAEQLSISN